MISCTGLEVTMDKKTWKKICQGHEETMKDVYEQHNNHIFRTCYYILYDKQLAEDALQNTFIKAFRSIKQLKNREAFKSWLTKIAVRESQTLYQKKESMKAADADNVIISHAETPESIVISDEEKVMLSQALGQLEEDDRTILILFYFNRCRISVIAEHLQLPEGTVKWRLHKARQALLKRLMNHSFSRDIYRQGTGGVRRGES